MSNKIIIPKHQVADSGSSEIYGNKTLPFFTSITKDNKKDFSMITGSLYVPSSNDSKIIVNGGESAYMLFRKKELVALVFGLRNDFNDSEFDFFLKSNKEQIEISTEKYFSKVEKELR